MKKLFFLTALLCASVMASAKQYCQEELTNSGKTIQLSCELKNSKYTITIEGENISGLGGSYFTINGSENVMIKNYIASNDGSKLIVEVTSSSAPIIYTPLYVLMPGEVNFGDINDITWGTCSTKQDPSLTVSPTSVTLDADASETAQISASRNGEGAITYESSNSGIASVSESGLITAVGAGTATITVHVASAGDYKAASKTITVTVTSSSINWAAIDWVGNGSGNNDYTNKFKVSLPNNVSVVNIQSSFGTEAGIYLTFPDGVSACDFGDGNYAIQGAGMLLYVSKFTKKVTTVNVTAVNEYEVLVYYEDGSDSATAITNTEVEAKAVKMIENGQLVIIKNGVKYNAIGTQL